MSILLTFKLNFVVSGVLIGLAMLFDFFDGFIARLLGVAGEFGKQLDSLADMITFGTAPAFMLYFLSIEHNGNSAWNYIFFIIPLLSSLRLAKFNIDTRQATKFYGLPTPANAIFFVSLCVAYRFYPNSSSIPLWLYDLPFLGTLSVIFSLLMISEIPMFSLKFKSYEFRENKFLYGFSFLCLGLIFWLKIWAFPVVIVLYIGISLFLRIFKKQF